MDPLVEKTKDAYGYCYQNPIKFIDPTGMSPEEDPIYGKNFWGKVKQIGDDGQNNNVSYLVKGSVKSDVRNATEQGANYTGPLVEGENVMKIPNGNILADVDRSVQATINSGNSPTTRLENGAHSLIGDTNARHWDQGTPQVTSTRTNSDGSTDIVQTWSVTPFRINGRQQPGGNGNTIEFIWHTHPNGSNPSQNETNAINGWRQNGFRGNSFLIDVNNSKVTFFNERGTIAKVPYNVFQAMGNRQNLN